MREQWDELKETIIELRDNNGTATQQECCQFLANLMNVLEAQMAPVRKKGKWEHGREVSRDYIGDMCVAIHYENWRCSNCNYLVDWGQPMWNYCPSCGADMRAQ